MSLLLHEHAKAMLGAGAFLAKVVSVQDPKSRNRVQVRLYNVDGITDQDATVWARVALPFAGNNNGAFFIPNVGDEVLVVHLMGDARFPIVLGSLWNGQNTASETIGGSGDAVDRWTIKGIKGTRIAIVEDSSGPSVELATPAGLSGVMTDSSGSIEFKNSQGTSIKVDASGITLNAPTGQVQITAATSVTVNAPQLTVSAGMSTFAGVVQCQVLQATTVVGTTYTPGAGNVW